MFFVGGLRVQEEMCTECLTVSTRYRYSRILAFTFISLYFTPLIVDGRIFFSLLILLLLYWGYIVTFTKDLTVYHN
jgi:hypothetical protein